MKSKRNDKIWLRSCMIQKKGGHHGDLENKVHGARGIGAQHEGVCSVLTQTPQAKCVSRPRINHAAS